MHHFACMRQGIAGVSGVSACACVFLLARASGHVQRHEREFLRGMRQTIRRLLLCFLKFRSTRCEHHTSQQYPNFGAAKVMRTRTHIFLPPPNPLTPPVRGARVYPRAPLRNGMRGALSFSGVMNAFSFVSGGWRAFAVAALKPRSLPHPQYPALRTIP